jgi:hypothetical protein
MAEGRVTQSVFTANATASNYVFSLHRTVLSSKLVKPSNDGVIGIKQQALIHLEGISFSKIVVILPVKIKKRGPIGTGQKRVLLPVYKTLK